MFLVDQEFISAGVNAYALGCTDEGLRKELVDMKESGVEIEGMQSYGGTTSLKSKIASEEVSHSFLLELEPLVKTEHCLAYIHKLSDCLKIVKINFVAFFFRNKEVHLFIFEIYLLVII